jgi:hypothetical protein
MLFPRARLQCRRSLMRIVPQRADFEHCLRLLPNIFIPQICVRADEFAHHADAFRVVENYDTGAVLPEEVFRTLKVLIFSNDDTGNAEQEGCARTHDAGTQSAHQCQFSPITPAAGAAQADGFGMCCGIAALHTQVVSTSDDLSVPVRENRTDGQTSFPQTHPCFFNSLEQ